MDDYAELPASLVDLMLMRAEATATPVARSTRASEEAGRDGRAAWMVGEVDRKGKGRDTLEFAASARAALAASGGGAVRARRLIDIFADERVSTPSASTTLASTASATATSTTQLASLSVILPRPSPGTIAGICVGATFILAGVLYLCLRRRLDFLGNRLDRDSESGPGAVEVAVGGKAVRIKEPEKQRAERRGATQDERRWRREIRLELEAEVGDLKRKEKEDMLRHEDMCRM